MGIGFAAVVVFFLILAGCSLQPLDNVGYYNDDTEDINDNLIDVGFSQLGSESDWRTANTKSIQESLTVENGFNLIFSNGRQKQENQIKAVRSFISQEVDYIVIAPVTETGWDTVLKEAKEADIPVIIVDRMVDVEDDSLYVTHIGSDLVAEGEKAGKWLEDYIDSISERKKSEMMQDGILNIVILEGTINSSAQLGRTKGFLSVASAHEEWNILASESGDFTKAKGKEVMEQYLKQFPDIDVLISQNDNMTFGAIEAIQKAGRTCGIDGEITIISFDAVSEAFNYMESGLINVEIECNPIQGDLISDVIRQLEQGHYVKKDIYVVEKVFEAEDAQEDRIGREY